MPGRNSVAKHLAHLHGQVREQSVHDLGLAQHSLLQRGQGAAIEVFQRLHETAFERGGRVAAEVIAVLEVDGLK